MSAKLKPDPDRMYVARETVSITTGPYDFITLRLGERRSGRDPVVAQHFEWFVDELDTSLDRLMRESKERQTAAIQAERDQRKAEREQAKRQAVEDAEQARIEAKRRRVVVYEPYTPEMANPLHPEGKHPMAHLAAGIAAAMGEGPR
jgi:hypothetical protein